MNFARDCNFLVAVQPDGLRVVVFAPVYFPRQLCKGFQLLFGQALGAARSREMTLGVNSRRSVLAGDLNHPVEPGKDTVLVAFAMNFSGSRDILGILQSNSAVAFAAPTAL